MAMMTFQGFCGLVQPWFSGKLRKSPERAMELQFAKIIGWSMGKNLGTWGVIITVLAGG
jgi:hypothetical protein